MNSRKQRRSRMLNSFATKQLSKCIKITAIDWQKLVRLRHAKDGYCKCVTCGKRGRWDVMDAGHFYSRRHPSVIFHPWNCWPQCKYCNRTGGKPYEFGEYLKRTIGVKGIATLEKIRYETKVWTREELVEMRLEFRDEIDQRLKTMV